jgi:hypothetical protein
MLLDSNMGWGGPDGRQLPGATDPEPVTATITGTWTQITALHSRTEHATVHNLTIADHHTYYVLASATPLLVHNESCKTLVLGIGQHGENLAADLRKAGFEDVFTLNNRNLRDVVGNVGGVPLTQWMQGVNTALANNSKVAVALDGSRV